jgi:hypothetical protein
MPVVEFADGCEGLVAPPPGAFGVLIMLNPVGVASVRKVSAGCHAWCACYSVG